MYLGSVEAPAFKDTELPDILAHVLNGVIPILSDISSSSVPGNGTLCDVDRQEIHVVGRIDVLAALVA